MILKKISLIGLLFLLILLPFLVDAQILDDSTQQVYGPTTTRFVLERDLIANKKRVYTVDTVLSNFHNYSFVNRNGNRYQDLGNLGTPIRPIFYVPPPQIGTYFGLNVYDLYAFTPDKIKYYDTKSPYSSLYYVQGGLLQQVLAVDFSRNIMPNWNAGFNYHRITAPKQFGTPNREDRQTDHQSIVFYTRYFNKDSTYQVLAHFSHLNHGMVNQGGIVQEAIEEGRKDSLFDYQDEESILKNASSRDYRNHYHVYHQYAFAKGFQLYHIFDRQRHVYDYRDLNLAATGENANELRANGEPFYPNVFFRPDTTDLSMRFLLHENQAGIKGSLANLDYRLYARRRDYSFSNKPAYVQKKNGAENFLGAWINYNLNDSAQIHGEAEYLLFRDYRLSAVYENKFWRIGHNRLYHSPTLIQQRIENNHFIWDNNFKPTLSDNTFAYFTVKIGGLLFAPFATFSNVKNMIYYDTLATPRQESRSVQILNVGLNLNLEFKKFHLENQLIYTRVSGAKEIIRIPEQFATSRLYYQNILFKGALETQVGVEAHYKSGYRPYGYMPVTGQFHLQDTFEADAYVVADAFVNVRIKRVRLFFKMAHANQGLPALGYFVAPYYTGLQRTFAFGANWLLFD